MFVYVNIHILPNRIMNTYTSIITHKKTLETNVEHMKEFQQKQQNNNDTVSVNDFYSMLYNEISKENDSENTTITNTEINHYTMCHITFEPLDPSMTVILECKHTFNYQPLFDEVYNQKYHCYVKETTRLGVNSIKCPYCRTVQYGILPPHPEYPNIYGVNTPIKYCMKTKTCKYSFLSGKNKGNTCGLACLHEYCNKHSTMLQKQANKKKNNNAKNESDTKSEQDNTKRCVGFIMNGKRKGLQCNSKLKHPDDLYCGKHKHLSYMKKPIVITFKK